MNNIRSAIRVMIGVIVLLVTVVAVVYSAIYCLHLTPIVCRSRTELEDALNLDLSILEDIQVDTEQSEGYTRLIVRGTVKEGINLNDYFARNIQAAGHVLKQIEIPPGDMEMLHTKGINPSDVIQWGCSFTDVRRGYSHISCSVFWYWIGRPNQSINELVLSTWIPRKMRLGLIK